MKIYFETLGCPKNFNDSEVAAGILEQAGHSVVSDPYEADAVIVNTCGFINDAKRESIEKIFDMVEICGEDKILAVSGCLSERYREELAAELPEVSLFVGVNEYENLPKLLECAEIGRQNCFYSGKLCDFEAFGVRKIPENPYSATLKISEGCNNTCAYCIIPSIRGKYRSRRIEDIVREAEQLAEAGTRELILIAQDVTNYGSDIYGKPSLDKLLKELCKIGKLHWIRLMYCYEDKITDELISVMAEEKKICKYIDIPIQHSSDKVLKAMNRRSTRNSIMSTIERLRTAMPEIAIRTTLITGFPGEVAADFDDLCDFVEDVRFDRLGVFAYSREEGTKADKMKGHVRQDVKEKRRDTIMRMQNVISLEKNLEKKGKIIEVLVEGRDDDGSYYGRSEFDAPEIDNSVLFTSDDELTAGEFVNVMVTDAFDYDLIGETVK